MGVGWRIARGGVVGGATLELVLLEGRRERSKVVVSPAY
jgi:hypothetical protein